MPGTKMTVSITGTLTAPRAEIANRINGTSNARFVMKVAKDTDYLVAARFDTAKAKAAAISGCTIITEAELNDFIEKGAFPARERRNSHVANWPEIAWSEVIEFPELFYLDYFDGSGGISSRYVRVTRRGNSTVGVEYFEAWDGLRLKTFRSDRVKELTRVSV